MTGRYLQREPQSPTTGSEAEGVCDEQLLDRMASRDESAFGVFYDRYSRSVYSLALRVVGSRTEAEDVTLDVFWQVWQQAAQYSPRRSKIYTWVMMIARTRAIDRLRRMKRQEVPADGIETHRQNAAEQPIDTDEVLFLAERRRRVRAALDSLTEPQRRAIELAYYEGLSQSEIALRLKEPLGTVKGQIRMGMARLRELLAVPCPARVIR